MDKREDQRNQFLAENGWRDCEKIPLAGDASPRKYFSLKDGTKTALLMDTPIELCSELNSFIEISEYLLAHGFSAPKIFARDLTNGFLIIEDLGPYLLNIFLKIFPEMEWETYLAALDVLVALREKPPPPNTPVYTPKIQGELAALSLTWYTRNIFDTEVSKNQVDELSSMISDAIAGMNEKQVFIHRDYHSENLLWLQDRIGLKRIGIIDFQDGSIGQSSYDLASLVEDARRYISYEHRMVVLERYAEITGDPVDMVERCVAVSGIQRNLRILGVFARLAVRDSKPGYLDYMPRVWDYLHSDLDIAEIYDLREFVFENVPYPEPQYLEKLRRR